MTTSILNKKKATKTAKVKNETLLRAKTMQRAAILFKQVSDPTRLQVVTLLYRRGTPCRGTVRPVQPEPACCEPPPGPVATRGNRRPPPPGQEQLLQPYRHRLSAFQHLQRHGLLNSPQDQAPSHSSNPKGVVGWFLLCGKPAEEAHLRATRKVKKSTPLPVRSRSSPE